MSDTEITATPETADAPPPEATEAIEGAEPTEPQDAKAGAKPKKEPDLDRAFMGLKRKRESLAQERTAFLKERQSFQQQQTEARQREAELAKKAAIVDAIAAGDEEALAQVMGEDFFDKLTHRRLNPERAEIEKAVKTQLAQYEKLLQEQRAKIEAIDAERRQAAVHQMRAAFVQSARSLQLDELDLLDDEEIVQHADAISAAWRQEHGEDPTFDQLARAIAAKEARRLERARAKFAKPVPLPADKPKAKGAPTTLTSSDATAPAGAGKKDVDWRAALVKKLDETLK